MKSIAFDPTQVTPAAAAEVVPPGSYEVVIAEALKRPARSGDGDFLQLGLQITRGEHAGRVVWSRLHIGSRIATIRAIAERELAAVCIAMGVAPLTHTDQLLNKRMMVTVGIRRRDGGDLSNVVRGYAQAISPKVGARADGVRSEKQAKQ